MHKNQIEDYIKKLQELEKSILQEEKTESPFMDELNELLFNLGDDIKGQITRDVNKFEVKVKKLNKNAVIPKYAKDGDAGMDLVATSIISNTTFDVTYGTGIAMEIPKGYVGLVFPRSSIRKTDLSLTNCVGVIDSGYRGEIQATFKKVFGKNDIRIDEMDYKVGDRIAQIMIIPYPSVTFIESDELSDSERGEGGFGSTGK
jgi:dUTP pyrophosphatase